MRDAASDYAVGAARARELDLELIDFILMREVSDEEGGSCETSLWHEYVIVTNRSVHDFLILVALENVLVSKAFGLVLW